MPGFTGANVVSNTAVDATKNPLLASLTNAGYLVWSIQAFNSHATDVIYIQFFDLAAGSVTVGTTTPTFVVALGPKDGCNIAFSTPIEFRTAVTVACTATATGSGAPAANAVLSISYTPA